MPDKFWQKWSNRVANAWAVLIGRAFACYHEGKDKLTAAMVNDLIKRATRR
jgi:hypothetical protein